MSVAGRIGLRTRSVPESSWTYSHLADMPAGLVSATRHRIGQLRWPVTRHKPTAFGKRRQE